MKEFESFTIKVFDRFYIVKPFWNIDYMLYEVFTNCDKLFTLKKIDRGSWVTNESDVIPIYADLVNDIGEALEEHESI